MCGIAGYMTLDNVPAAHPVVRRMTDAIAHRGPDGEGAYVDGPVALGHRRLAIIDLSDAGRQPMATEDGRFVISYNGEVYNFQELRTELQAHGHQFHSRTDTEVVLKAWAQWGQRSLSRFNGMFAFAVWDTREKVLTLARDRYGVKPVYWALAGNTFMFGSEVKALLAHGGLAAEMDAPALFEYMTFQNFFTERTLFKDVKLLPAASILRLKLGNREPDIQRYWDYHFREPADTCRRSREDYAAELGHLFRQAVTRQLVGDVPVSSYLSGGIDSGSVTAVAAQHMPHIRTFTVGFDLHSVSGLELGTDERSTAEHMSYLFKTEQYEMVLKAGDMERCLPEIVRHLEEPRVGQSYPNYYAAGLASKFGKVVLSGAGGDEMFGGYPWRYYRAVVNNDFDQYIDKYYAYWHRLMPNTVLKQLLAPVSEKVEDVWTRDIFRGVFDHHADSLTSPKDYINHSLYMEAKTFLHGILVVEDKLSMAHGLETRVPFLDNDLVDFAMQVPVDMKLGNLGEVVRLNENEPGGKTRKYFEKTRDGKLIMRESMRAFLPDVIVDREKQGFSAPDASWFRGESIDYVKRQLMDRRPRLADILDLKIMRGLINEHLDGKQNRRLLIWSLLYLEQWCEEWL